MRVRKLNCRIPVVFLSLLIGIFISAAPVAQALAAQSCQEYDVEMRDGVLLYTRVFLPDPAVYGPGPYPTILAATPYGVAGYTGRGQCSDPLYIPNNAQAANGYAYAYQDTRGRFLSGGMWTRRDDGRDGYDTIAWIAQQPWCNKKIGMGGSSALGLTTYMTAGQRPPYLMAIQPSIASANSIQHFTFEGQALQYETTLGWRSSNVYSGLSQSHYDGLGLTAAELAAAKADMASVYADVLTHLTNPLDSPSWMRLPFYDFPGISPLLPSWNEVLLHPSGLDPYYDDFNVQDKIQVPGLHWGGWYDIYGRGSLESFQAIQENVGNQKLLMTNGVHRTVGLKHPYPAGTKNPYYRWFDYWLKGIDNGIMDEPPVAYYRMVNTIDTPQTGEWKYADQWPLPDVQKKKYFLHGNGKLSPNTPSHKDVSLSYQYDPNDPVPTMGGRNLYIPAGAMDQSNVEPPYRSDVLIYKSDVLPNDVEVSGNVKVVLHASSDCKDTDFTAKVIDVYPDGRTVLILDSVIRARYRDSFKREKLLHPGQRYEFVLDLGDTSQVFKAGHRIQVDISSSNFPIRDRNTNTGNALYIIDTAEDAKAALNTIYHAAQHPSYVVLPIVTPKTRIFAGQASIKTPSLTYEGPAELHTLANGVYLRLMTTPDNRWIKWDIKNDRDTPFLDYYKCVGKLGPLSVWVHTEGEEPFFAFALGKGVLFEGTPQ